MMGGDDNKQGLSDQQCRQLLDWVASRVRSFMAQRLGPLFDLAVEHFLDAAGQASSQGEQSHFFDAYKRIRVERQAFAGALLLAVDYNFRALGRGDKRTGDDDDLSLQLVANDLLEEMILLDNMVSKVVSRCDRSLDLLTERLSAIVGRPISEKSNPLVPEFLCEAFSRQAAALKLEFSPKLVLYKLFESAVLTDWPNLVQECNDHLLKAGVLPDLEKKRPAIRKSPASDVPAKPARPDMASGRQPYRPAPPDYTGFERPVAPPGIRERVAGTGSSFARRGPGVDLRTGDVLADLQRHLREQERRRVGERGGDSGDAAPSQQASALDADQLASLFTSWRNNLDHQQRLDALASQGLEGALEDILGRSGQSLDALSTVDRGLLRVIDRTFDCLKAMVRQQHEMNLLLNLALPAAWLALKDPLFLERRGHPGRRLMNELCRVASTLEEGESRHDPLRGKVDEIIERLNSFDVTLNQQSQLLAELIDVIEKDRRNTSLREERVLQEADSQARLAEARDQVIRMLTDRLVGRRWPAFLVPFCEKAWSRVLFMTLLREGGQSVHGPASEEWRRVQGLLDRLLVRVAARRAVSDDERSELVSSLGAELQHIGYDPGEARRHLDNLSAFFARLPAAGGRDGDVLVERLSVDLPGQSCPSEDVPREIDSETLAFVDALRRGAWLEFRDEDGKTLRCRLAGSVRASSQLIFTNRRGVKVAQEHRHRMAVKMQEGKVIVLDNSHLFDQAYNDVLNDVQGELRSQTSHVG